jgi:cysteinyl-tRNA synthetase
VLILRTENRHQGGKGAFSVRNQQPTSTMNVAQVAARLRDREIVRAAKDWAAADRIRDELRSSGVEVGKD